jgi:hypothetical protein
MIGECPLAALFAGRPSLDAGETDEKSSIPRVARRTFAAKLRLATDRRGGCSLLLGGFAGTRACSLLNDTFAIDARTQSVDL